MARVMVKDVGGELCRILGVDPSLVTCIELQWRPGKMAYFDLRFAPSESQMGEFTQMVQRYRFEQEEGDNENRELG